VQRLLLLLHNLPCCSCATRQLSAHLLAQLPLLLLPLMEVVAPLLN
jgi:hypothetical protein